jgi:hypothetical protein
MEQAYDEFGKKVQILGHENTQLRSEQAAGSNRLIEV